MAKARNEDPDSTAPPGWMTFDEVRTYLGHERFESTEVWLSRHGIKPVRHYRRSEVIREREPNKAGTPTALRTVK